MAWASRTDVVPRMQQDLRPNPDRLLAEVQEAGGQAEARQAEGLLRHGGGRRQDVRHARGGPHARGRGAGRRWSATPSRTSAPETEALLLGMEILPYKVVEYRNAKLKEFDLDAALARKPALVCVDELAHTNAPGMRHPKRWQDVVELLDAGINVYTTLNVQHLESVNDIVERITGVQRPRDAAGLGARAGRRGRAGGHRAGGTARAVPRGKGLPPGPGRAGGQALLHQGQPDRAARAGAADDGPARRRADAGFPPRGRGARAVAGDASACSSASAPARCPRGWCARPSDWRRGCGPSGSPRTSRRRGSARLSDADRRRVEQTLRLAEQLGARTVTLRGDNVADEVIAYAQAHNVTKIVIGKPERPRWRDVLFGSVVDDLIRRSGEIDIYVIRGDADDGRRAAAPPTRPPAASRLAGLRAGRRDRRGVTTAIGWPLYHHARASRTRTS